MMLEGFATLMVLLAAIAGGTVVLAPLARALARRLEGRNPGAEYRLRELEEEVARLREEQSRVEDLESRLAFTEDLVAGRRRLSSGKREQRRPFKVGKLWTPPPYEA